MNALWHCVPQRSAAGTGHDPTKITVAGNLLMVRRFLLVVLLAATTSALGFPFLTSASTPAGARDLGTLWINQTGRVTYRVFGGRPPSMSSPAAVDPDLEPGFPVQAFHGGGSYWGGPGIHTLVADITGDARLEIITTGLAGGPLYAWKNDGTPLAGWPVGEGGAAYPTIGRLERRGRNVFSAFFGYWISGYAADGSHLPGWPRRTYLAPWGPGTTANVTGTRKDEIFGDEQDYSLHGYKATGRILPGWPVRQVCGGQARSTPSIADLDGDGDLEILTASEPVSPTGVCLFAYHHDGTSLSGFPVVAQTYLHNYPVIGDVDGDSELEIVVVGLASGVQILSAGGALERSLPFSGMISYGSAPALADLNGDGIPEIILQSDGGLDVWYGDGRGRYPGWPVRWTGHWAGNSAPVVGDVDGDMQPEIVITSQIAGSGEDGQVRVYNSNGTLHPHFPKALKIGAGAVPAIADIDLDGRNEIVVCGAFWNGHSGMYDKCWAYDLGGGPHGPILWGQFGGNAAHQGRYPVP